MEFLLGGILFVLGGILGLLAGITGNLLTPLAGRLLAVGANWVAAKLDRNRYSLNGTWMQTYLEPDPVDPTIQRAVRETITVTHVVSHVMAVGKTDVDPRTFEYVLQTKNSMVYGAYFKKSQNEQSTQAGSISGTGMVQLIINPGITKMSGQATWFDADTDQIESTPVTWVRV